MAPKFQIRHLYCTGAVHTLELKVFDSNDGQRHAIESALEYASQSHERIRARGNCITYEVTVETPLAMDAIQRIESSLGPHTFRDVPADA